MPDARSDRSTWSAPLVALAGWVIPGAGYYLIGHKARGLIVLGGVLFLFVGGMLIGGAGVVDAPSLSGSGSMLGRVFQKPWFIGQVLAGPISIIGALIAPHVEQSHARVFEIGTLYTAVAGMLNLMTIIDASHRASRGDVR